MYSAAGNYITSSLEKEKQVLIKYIPHILSNQKKKDIHKIRVAVKKINATYGLIEFIFPTKFNRKEHYGRVKDMFQDFGKLREIQLMNMSIKEFNLPSGPKKIFKKFASREKERALEKLEVAVKGFNKKSVDDSIVIINYLSKNLSKILLTTKIKQFINKKTKRIITLTKGNKTNAKIHEIRKNLKSINYMVVFLGNLNPSEKINTISTPLTETGKIIGAWHDRIKLIHFIDKLTEENPNSKPEVIRPFRAIKNRLSHKNLNTLTLLKPKLNDIILTLKSI